MGALFAIAALSAQAATAAPAPPPATTEAPQGPRVGSVTYVDLEGGVGYSTNPNLSFANGNGTGFGRLAVHAVHTRVSARTSTSISAFAQDQFYTHRLGSQQSFDLLARHDAAVSEKLRVFGDADVAYDKGGQLDTRVIGLPIVVPPVGTTIPPVLFVPSGDFLTVSGRTYRADGHIGAQLALSSREFLNLSTGIEHSVFKSGSFDSRFTTIPVTVGYDRRVSTRATVGARVSYQHTKYSGGRSYDSITPQATTQISLSPTMSFVGAVGASFSSVDDGIRRDHSVGLSADANLCSTGERSQLCEHASVRQVAATAAGPATVMSLGVDYSRRLDADETLQFSLGAERYSNPKFLVTSTTFSRVNYFRLAGEYDRKIGRRLFGGVSVAARKLTQSGPDPDADLTASVFVRYRLGDLQ